MSSQLSDRTSAGNFSGSSSTASSYVQPGINTSIDSVITQALHYNKLKQDKLQKKPTLIPLIQIQIDTLEQMVSIRLRAINHTHFSVMLNYLQIHPQILYTTS